MIRIGVVLIGIIVALLALLLAGLAHVASQVNDCPVDPSLCSGTQ